jgi:uncharacterized protein (TIGR02147 family)
MKRPLIFEYLDVGLYLQDVYKYRKSQEKNFSYAAWAEEMGIRSRAYLRALVLKEKPIHESIVPALIQGLRLNDEEVEYFDLLLRHAGAVLNSLKEAYGRQLLIKWKGVLQKIEIKDMQEFLSDPLIPVVFTYLSFDDSAPGVQDMARDLGCDVGRLQTALRCLIWQKLVNGEVREDGSVTYKAIETFFSVPSLPQSQVLKRFHLEGLSLAEQASELPSEQRKYYSTFMAADEAQFQKAQALIQDFNQRLLALLGHSQLRGKKIYRLNIQIFPVSNTVGETDLPK